MADNPITGNSLMRIETKINLIVSINWTKKYIIVIDVTEVGKNIKTNAHITHLNTKQLIILLSQPNLFNLGANIMPIIVTGIKIMLVIELIVFLEKSCF